MFIKLSTIKANPNNPRIIKDDRFHKLVKNILLYPSFLVERPIVHKDTVIIGGNMRHRAVCYIADLSEPEYNKLVSDTGLINKKIVKIWNDIRDKRAIPDSWIRDANHYTEEEVKAFTIIDNVPFGDHDWDILANEWDADQLTEWGLEIPNFDLPAPEAEEDEYVIPKDIVTNIKEGDFFEIGNHRLLCGDSTKKEDIQRLMAGAIANMCFTDPPWNVAIGSFIHPKFKQNQILNDNVSVEHFNDFLLGFASQMQDILDGDLYCVLGASEWPTLDINLRKAGYHWSSTIIWVKDQFVLGRSKYHRRYEPIWYGWHKKSKSSYVADRKQDDVWEVPRPKVSELHPTMKPVKLVEMAINNSSIMGQIVYEPFCGSGTTMIACEQLQRKCYAMELAPKYCQVIIDRMKLLNPNLLVNKNGIEI